MEKTWSQIPDAYAIPLDEFMDRVIMARQYARKDEPLDEHDARLAELHRGRR